MQPPLNSPGLRPEGHTRCWTAGAHGEGFRGQRWLVSTAPKWTSRWASGWPLLGAGLAAPVSGQPQDEPAAAAGLRAQPCRGSCLGKSEPRPRGRMQGMLGTALPPLQPPENHRAPAWAARAGAPREPTGWPRARLAVLPASLPSRCRRSSAGPRRRSVGASIPAEAGCGERGVQGAQGSQRSGQKRRVSGFPWETGVGSGP